MGDVERASEEFIDAFNAHDEQRMREGYADDVVFEAPGGVRSEGADAATEYAMGFLRAFPDTRATVQNKIVAGDWVAYQLMFEGTHEGTLEDPSGSIPATHKRVTGRAAELVRFRDGKVVEEYLYFDQMELLTQLGVMPETATA